MLVLKYNFKYNFKHLYDALKKLDIKYACALAFVQNSIMFHLFEDYIHHVLDETLIN